MHKGAVFLATQCTIKRKIFNQEIRERQRVIQFQTISEIRLLVTFSWFSHHSGYYQREINLRVGGGDI